MARIVLIILGAGLLALGFLFYRADGIERARSFVEGFRAKDESLCIQLIDFRPPPSLNAVLPDRDAREALLADRKNSKTLSDYAYLLFEDRQDEEALLCADDAVAKDKESAHAYYVRSLLYRAADKSELAFQDAKKSVELDPKNEETWRLLGDLAVGLRRSDELLEIGANITENLPESSMGHYYTGQANAMLGRYEEALEAYERYAEMRNSPVRVYYNRGILLRDLGRYEEAIQEFETAETLNDVDPEPIPNFSGALAQHRGLTRVLMGDAQAGVNELRAAVFKYRLRGSFVFYALGYGYELLGDEARARRFYEKGAVADTELDYLPDIEGLRASALLRESQADMKAYLKSKVRSMPSPLLFEDEKED